MIRRLEKLLLLAFFIFFPSQLALHFWPNFSIISGQRVDYLAPTLYFTDLLLLSLLLLKLPKIVFNLSPIFVLVILNIIFSIQPWLTLYFFSRFALYYIFAKYLLENCHLWLPRLPTLLSLTVGWTGFLAIWQFTLQQSLGGLTWFIGERPLYLTSSAVAKISLANLGLFLRAYSVFPHPNALAGFLLVSFWLLFFFKSKLIVLIPLLIFLTFSRTSLFVLSFTLLIYFLVKHRFLKTLILLIVTVLITCFAFNFGASRSTVDRLILQNQSINLIFSNPLFGVGLGNLPLLTLQPVHNIYLLLLTQLGILFTFYLSHQILKYLKLHWRNIPFSLRLAVLSLAGTGLLDHYWLTSPANTLIIVILIVVIYAKSATRN